MLLASGKKPGRRSTSLIGLHPAHWISGAAVLAALALPLLRLGRDLVGL